MMYFCRDNKARTALQEQHIPVELRLAGRYSSVNWVRDATLVSISATDATNRKRTYVHDGRQQATVGDDELR